jgi:ribosomal protein L7Ae-like RNA K-turn-binding protein
MISESAKRKILGLAGLGIRGRLAVVGVEQVRDAAKRGRLKIALVASDASQNSLDKVESLLTAKKVRIVREFSGRDLGEISGRETVAAIGVSDAGLARGITSAISAESRR